MGLKERLKNLIYKDTSRENESNKMAVLVRILCIALMIFFALHVVLFGIIWKPSAALGNLVLFLLYLGMFGFTFRMSKSVLVGTFIFVTTVWAFAMLLLFGLDSCFQMFPPFLIVIYFFSSYGGLRNKAIFGCVTYILYLLMSFLYGMKMPLLELTSSEHQYIRDSSMLIIILCTCIAAYIFAKDSQSMEYKLISYNKKLQEKASTDPLTRLHNRGRAMEYLQTFADKADEMLCSICICDIDFFKRVNDTYGHDIGDMVLKAVARTMLDTLNSKCFIARWGGEEFFIAFPNCNGDDAMVMLFELQKALKRAIVRVRDKEICVTLTYGLVEYDNKMTVDENIKEADRMLYMGKEQGRDRIIF